MRVFFPWILVIYKWPGLIILHSIWNPRLLYSGISWSFMWLYNSWHLGFSLLDVPAMRSSFKLGLFKPIATLKIWGTQFEHGWGAVNVYPHVIFYGFDSWLTCIGISIDNKCRHSYKHRFLPMNRLIGLWRFAADLCVSLALLKQPQQSYSLHL